MRLLSRPAKTLACLAFLVAAVVTPAFTQGRRQFAITPLAEKQYFATSLIDTLDVDDESQKSQA